MLQSSGKVTRKKVKPVNKPSNQRPASHHTNTAATANHQTSGSDNVANTPGDSPASLPAEVEQIFEVNTLPMSSRACVHACCMRVRIHAACMCVAVTLITCSMILYARKPHAMFIEHLNNT